MMAINLCCYKTTSWDALWWSMDITRAKMSESYGEPSTEFSGTFSAGRDQYVGSTYNAAGNININMMADQAQNATQKQGQLPTSCSQYVFSSTLQMCSKFSNTRICPKSASFQHPKDRSILIGSGRRSSLLGSDVQQTHWKQTVLSGFVGNLDPGNPLW